MTKEYKFTAKRLDNGELIEGSLLKNDSWSWIISYVQAISTDDGLDPFKPKTHQVDPSTITPLFTTDKPEEWLFENVEELELDKVTDEQKLTVVNSWLHGVGALESCTMGLWAKPEDLKLRNHAFRVKAEVYSIDNAMTDISLLDPNTLGYSGKVKEIISKLGGNNE